MADSQVIARRFRPQTFAEVVGQEAITRTLTNAIETERLHHAYLFAGARGVGKTTTARILAKALNCVTGITTSPCGVCPSCSEIANSASIDVMEIDAASNTGVENVREAIIATVAIAPARDRFKIFIIDEVHQLSSAAFNALLKTLEEPPPRVLFVLATTEMHKVPETILSRCQVFEFRTIPSRQIYAQLKRIGSELGIEISESALLGLARAGEGSMRDAESALDQVLSFAGKVVTEEDVSAALGLVGFETLNTITRAIRDEDSGAILRIVDSVVSRGYDLRNLCRQMMTHFRALLVIKIAGLDQDLLEVSQTEADSLPELAEAFSEQDLIRFFTVLTKTEQDIRLSSQPRFQLELGLVKLVHAKRLYLLEEAVNEIKNLSGKTGVAGVAAGAIPPPRRPADTRPSTGSVAAPLGPSHSRQSTTRHQPPNTRVSGSPPPEPPPLDDEPRHSSHSTAAPSQGTGTGDVATIRAILESRNKQTLLHYLDGAEACTVEGDLLRISVRGDDPHTRPLIEGRRGELEQLSSEALGRKVRVAIGSRQEKIEQQQPPLESTAPPPGEMGTHPAVRALVDMFHGEIVEVKKRGES